MKAMILAAGEGRRMLPLTATTPKPLLQVRGKSLLEHHIERLRSAGVTEIIINVAYLGEQIVAALGGGEHLGVRIDYSREPQPLETAGGLLHALDLLGSQPFLLINGDVWTDYPFANLCSRSDTGLGHLVFVPNPPFKTRGDYSLDERGCVVRLQERGLTFAGISLLSPDIVRCYPTPSTHLPLLPVFNWAVEQGALTGELYQGSWSDVGTPERLAELNKA